MSYYLIAQEAVKQKEIGLIFSNLDNFGLTFRTGTAESLWRFNTLLITGNNRKNTNEDVIDKQNNIEVGISVGKEFRKSIIQNIELRYGADLSFNYSLSKSNTDVNNDNTIDRSTKNTNYTPGINLVLGLNYKLSDHFVIGAEVLPYFIYTAGTVIQKTYLPNNTIENESKSSAFNYGLSNRSVLLSLVYRY